MVLITTRIVTYTRVHTIESLQQGRGRQEREIQRKVEFQSLLNRFFVLFHCNKLHSDLWCSFQASQPASTIHSFTWCVLSARKRLSLDCSSQSNNLVLSTRALHIPSECCWAGGHVGYVREFLRQRRLCIEDEEKLCHWQHAAAATSPYLCGLRTRRIKDNRPFDCTATEGSLLSWLAEYVSLRFHLNQGNRKLLVISWKNCFTFCVHDHGDDDWRVKQLHGTPCTQPPGQNRQSVRSR